MDRLETFRASMAGQPRLAAFLASDRRVPICAETAFFGSNYSRTIHSAKTGSGLTQEKMRERAFLVGVKEMGKPGWETLKPSGSVKTTSRLYVFTSKRAALVAAAGN